MIKIPCPVCCGDGFASFGDRHVENRKEVCTRCKGAGEIDPETGQRPETSSGAGVDGGLYAARFGQGKLPPQAETPGLDREAIGLRNTLINARNSLAILGSDVDACRKTICEIDAILAATAVSQPPTSRQGVGEFEDDLVQHLLAEAGGCDDLAVRASIERRFREGFAEAAMWFRKAAERIIALEAVLPAQPGPAPVGDGGE